MNKKILISIIISLVVICIATISIVIINSNSGNEEKKNKRNTHSIMINGTSMEPTLKEKEIVFYEELDTINRFDIIVFKEGNNKLIKRVYALPNENIKYEDNKFYIDGKEIPDQYGYNDNNDYDFDYDITMKDDEYFVLGDNRNISRDSRMFGAVKKENILGVLVFELE